MRIWHPIPPAHLDTYALQADHHHVHIALLLLTRPSKTKADRELRRWILHRRALVKRHNADARELKRRGLHHGTPIHPGVLPPARYRDARGPVPLRSGETFAQMRALLRFEVRERLKLASTLQKDRADGRFE